MGAAVVGRCLAKSVDKRTLIVDATNIDALRKACQNKDSAVSKWQAQRPEPRPIPPPEQPVDAQQQQQDQAADPNMPPPQPFSGAATFEAAEERNKQMWIDHEAALKKYKEETLPEWERKYFSWLASKPFDPDAHRHEGLVLLTNREGASSAKRALDHAANYVDHDLETNPALTESYNWERAFADGNLRFPW